MNTYKTRGECSDDLEKLSMALRSRGIDAFVYATQDEHFPDCVAAVVTAASINDLRSAIASIPDSHVMLETVRNAFEYDGIRRP